MGKPKSPAALRQQQRARARDEKHSSSSNAAEGPTPDMGSLSLEPEVSDKEESAPQVQTGDIPDVLKLDAYLQELFPNDNTLSRPSPTTMFYEIREAPGKGLGMFAITAIPRGTRILADAPLFSVKGPKARVDDIEAAYQSLSIIQKHQFDALRCPEHPHKSAVQCCWEANCFGMDEDTGIFLQASRINHSCCPNACFRWNPRLKKLTVHAITDIAAGAEIETSYMPPAKETSKRTKSLEHWGFECACEACNLETSSGQEHERRRLRMGDLYAKSEGLQMYISDFGGMLGKKGDELLNLHLELISLLESEGLFLTELGYRYRCVARYYIDKGEKQKAVRYAISGLENDLNCFGADSPLVEDAADFLKLIQGQRQQYQFGGSDGYFKYS